MMRNLILFPAIDLKDGQCVRLYKGDMETATVFNDNPAAQAKAFEDAGAAWLHLVDLNGAFAGQPVNGAAVERILAAVSMPVQLGGGIRDMATIAMWLEKGVRRVILGTVAVKNPGLVTEAATAFPGQVVVGIDARGGMVAVDGWADTTSMPASDLAKAFEDAGVAAIVYTDIDRDGALTGVNVEATAALAEAVSIPVIASGGVAGPDDLDRLMTAAADCRGTIEGVISGRAIYDGRLDLKSALKQLGGAA
jgi:phosphoribosylformimino-5-aminoimidazole carboxamide ribotide isomerase